MFRGKVVSGTGAARVPAVRGAAFFEGVARGVDDAEQADAGPDDAASERGALQAARDRVLDAAGLGPVGGDVAGLEEPVRLDRVAVVGDETRRDGDVRRGVADGAERIFVERGVARRIARGIA